MAGGSTETLTVIDGQVLYIFVDGCEYACVDGDDSTSDSEVTTGSYTLALSYL